MVIGYSAKHMLEEEGQLGLFGRLTVEAMAEHFQHDDYILYAPDTKNDTTCINNLLVHSSVHLKTPHSSGFGNDNSKAIVQATHRHGVQVFHGLATDIPEGLERNGIATVLTVGNLLHKHYPERYSWTERFFINRAFKKALKSVDAVVAMSEFSKSEIIDQYGVDPEKIRVIMPVCEKVFAESVSNEAKKVHRQRFGLPERYILVPGMLDERNNMLKVVDALAKLGDDELGIVVIGHRNGYYQKIKAHAAHLELPNPIVRIRERYNAAFNVVYAMASVVAYPSRYECASMPIMRCLSCGTPVVAATGSCMEEYGGDAALYFNPDSADELADAISRAMGSEREALLAAAKVQNEKFTSLRLATQYRELYHELRSNKKHQ